MRKIAIYLFALSAVGTAGYALAGLFLLSIQSHVFRELVSNVSWSGTLHVGAGGLALLLGLIQISPQFRKRSISVHRNVGRVYVILVLLSTAGAMVSLPYSTASISAKSAFWFLAILWPTVTIAGYPAKSDFSRAFHAKCMIFSFALTCTAISLRLYLGLMLAMGIDFDVCYPIAAWGGIVTNSALAWLALNLRNQ